MCFGVTAALAWVIADVVLGFNMRGLLGPVIEPLLRWVLLVTAVATGVVIGLNLYRRQWSAEQIDESRDTPLSRRRPNKPEPDSRLPQYSNPQGMSLKRAAIILAVVVLMIFVLSILWGIPVGDGGGVTVEYYPSTTG